MPLFLLAFVALVPLLWMFGSSDQIKRKYNLRLYYILFLSYNCKLVDCKFSAGNRPILLWSGLALCFIHPLFFLIPFWFYFTIRKKFGKNAALWTFPIGFLAFEYLHSLGEASYPWLTLGYTQMQNTMWVQFIDITGIWGASLLVLYGNVLCLKLVEHLQKLPKRVRLRNLWELPQRKYTISFMAVLLLPIFMGLTRMVV
jgi:apolipoprotein N-acyltransferase